MRIGRYSLLGVLVVAVVCGVMLAPSALAASTRSLLGTFGSFGAPRGMAVDQASGAVYVADTGSNRVEKFSATGTFIFAVGKEVDETTGGDLCTAASGDTCGRGSQSTTPGEFERPYFVAVDSSGGLSAGDFYVGDGFDGLVSKFDASGHLVTTWGSLGQLNGSTATDGPFGQLVGIAVDSSGNLLVLNGGSCSGFLFKFAQDGTFKEDFATPGCSLNRGLGIGTSGKLFKVNLEDSIEELTSTGADVGQVAQAEAAAGLAVDPATGDVYGLTFSGTVAHYAFNGSGEVLEPFGATCAVVPSSGGCGPTDTVNVAETSLSAAVDSASGNLYVAGYNNGTGYIYGPPEILPDVATGAASSVAPTSATLEGEVDPNGLQVSDCHFDYGTTTFYGHTAACVETIGSGSTGVTVHADVSGLLAGTTYHFRLEASNAHGTSDGQDATFSTPPSPSIDSATASNVTSSSADLNALIDPNGYDTTYRFEWGTSSGYGTSVPVPDADIGSGTGDVAVTVHLSGLSANTTYHWRIVASNVNGTATGSELDHTFVYGTSGTGLPDDRAYEMVTPAQKNGALVGFGVFIAPPSVSEDGSRVVANSIQCFGGAQSCTAERASEGQPYLFSRTPSGWVTTALAPPAAQFDSPPSDVANFADTGAALFSAATPPGGEDDFWLREPDGSLADVGPAYPPSLGAQGSPFPGLEDATPDLSHLVYRSYAQWPFDAGSGLYEYIGVGNSQPVLVGVTGGRVSTDLVSVCGTSLNPAKNNEVSPVSADGRTVFFTALACGSGSGVNAGRAVPANELYARIDESQTVAISQRSPTGCTTPACTSSPPADARFIGASNDGSKAFFQDAQQLTDSATQGAGNLYEYDFANPAGHNLIDVSAGDTSGQGPSLGGVLAISADGSHVYFVSSGVLTEAPNAQGQSAEPRGNNLYVFERDTAHPSGHVAFIAALAGSDSSELEIGHANVTPDGRFLLFTSHNDLTSDDVSRTGAAQVFRYDSQSGQLVRVSVGNDGFNDNGNAGSPSLCAEQTFRCTADATIANAELGFDRHDPSMSHDGSFVFFQSPAGLTPQALDYVRIGSTDGGHPTYAQNIYEYHDGHVYLISDGRDTATISNNGFPAVQLLGADASGANVFFTTTDQLVAQDTDTQRDIYDARVCTASDPCVTASASLPPCLGEACHGIPTGTPSVPGAPTVTFNGQGNLPGSSAVRVGPRSKRLTRAQKLARALKACGKVRSRKRRIACRHLARERYGPPGGARKSIVAGRAVRNGRSK
jgi:hypothetical protein